MQIKKYTASTLKEAIELMKTELGDEAIVLSTKVLEGRGANGGKVFEITAGMDNLPSPAARNPYNPPVKPIPKPQNDDDEPLDIALEELRKKIYQAKQTGPGQHSAPKPVAAKAPGYTPAPIRPTATQHRHAPKATDEEKAPAPKRPPAAEGKNAPANQEEMNRAMLEKKRASGAQAFMLENIKQSLLEKDIQPSIVNQIIAQLTPNLPFLKPSDIESTLVSTMAAMIPTAGFEINKRKSGKVIAVVGPTGVGKTTCIAKLAVISKLLHKLDIGLISIDTYRLGAIDQLKIFSDVSDIDFLVAYDAKDLATMINKFRHKDIIFIDTAGRSQNNTKYLQEMKAMLSTVNVAETILVMSASGASAALIDTAKKFGIFNYSGLIFTKLDEAVTYGNLLNVAHKSQAPVKYLTNGQVIPDDIIAADSEHIANIIYSGKVTAS